MENPDKYEKKYINEEYLKDLNSHLPKWVNMLVELYTSPLKYKLKYEKAK